MSGSCRPDKHMAFPLVYDCLSYAVEGLAQIRRITRKFYKLLLTRRDSELFQCGIVTGKVWGTDDDNADRWCGFPSSHYFASPDPYDASCGS